MNLLEQAIEDGTWDNLTESKKLKILSYPETNFDFYECLKCRACNCVVLDGSYKIGDDCPVDSCEGKLTFSKPKTTPDKITTVYDVGMFLGLGGGFILGFVVALVFF